MTTDTRQAELRLPYAVNLTVSRGWRVETDGLMSCSVHTVTLAFRTRYGWHWLRGECLEECIDAARDEYARLLIEDTAAEQAACDLLLDEMDGWLGV